MRITRHALTLLTPLLMLAGCIVGDELTTITIHPDGSADLVTFRSNLHSTQSGGDGERELADYKATFDARTQDEMVRVRENGGTIVQASWIRESAPLANVFSARLPNAAAFEKLGTLKNDDGTLQISTQWQSDGVRRRVVVNITARLDTLDLSQLTPTSVDKFRQKIADGISETRLAVTGGPITSARGFTVADDKQSALLDVPEIARLLAANRGEAKLFLEWEVPR